MINESKVKKYCRDDLSKIENYEKAIADTTQTWDCHHRTEIWWNCSKQELIENECYYNRKACELIFLTHAEHARLHSMNMSDETRKKMSEAKKGDNHPLYGKQISEEHRRKICESNRRRTVTDETIKKMSEANKGRTLSDETRRKISEANKGKHLSEETKKKMAEARKGKHHSEESRKKMSEARKAYLAKR